MNSIVPFFNDIPSWQRTLILAAGFVLMWMLESAIPLLRTGINKPKHTGINLFFTGTTLIVNFLFAAVLVMASDFTTRNHFGILYLADLPLWAHAVFGLLLLDFIGAFVIHVLAHKVKWMWKFHAVHHSEPHVNTTSALRHHPGESVFRAVFTTLAILIAGTPVWMVMIYQSASALFSQFNHANIHLPKWLDSMIAIIFVSPGMHKVHHHYLMPVTDTNYGNIFSVWDRLFQTFVSMKTSDIHYGLDIYPKAEEHSRLTRLIRMPFEKYRAPVGSKFGKPEMK